MKMIILILVSFFALAWGWRRVLTWDWCIGTNAQHVVVTCVGSAIVMRLVLMFFVLNMTFVLLGVLVALLGGVLSFWPMHQAWPERLVAAIRSGLCPAVSYWVCCSYYNDRCRCNPAACSIGDSTCCLACCGNRHLCDVVPSHGRPSHCTACAVHGAYRVSCVARFDAQFFCQGAIRYLQIKDVLEVLCDRLEHLVAKTLTALNVLCPVLWVEGHVKPLKL